MSISMIHPRRAVRTAIGVITVAFLLARPVLAVEEDNGALQGKLTIDRLEMQRSTVDQSGAGFWLADGWVGGETNKLLIRSEGNYSKHRVINDLTQLLYGRSISDDWVLGIGAAHTGGPDPSQNWLDLSVEGDLPLGIESEWMLFWNRDQRAWLKTDFETIVPLRGAWNFVPRLELNFHARNDPVHQVGTGLSDGELSLRIAYEFTKQVAAYGGYARYQTFGNTAAQLSKTDSPTFDNLLIAGLRVAL